MKVFDLICTSDHRFEGWFSSADDFERQCERGIIACPVCGDTQVIKVPSASYVNKGASDRSAAKAKAKAEAPEPSAEQVQYANFRSAMLAKLAEYVVKNTEDVGTAFPEEARKIHYGEAPERKIRGTASAEEVSELREEGIDVVRLPLPLPAGKTH